MTKSKDIATNYLGVKFSSTTTNHFSSAKEHFVKAGNAAIDCATYAAKTGGSAYLLAGNVFGGVVAYDFLCGKIMTAHAFGWAMPTYAKAAVAVAAGICHSNPYTALGIAVGGAILLSPEKAYNFGENAFYTLGAAAECTYNNLAGVVHLAAGVANAAVDIGHAIYDNSPSHDINADAMMLTGATPMLAIEGF